MNSNQKVVRSFFVILSALIVISCSGYSVIRKQVVPEVPAVRYERIIKLDNPEGHPDRTLAGLVHVTGRAKVCADYPREVIINSFDDRTFMAKQAFPSYQNYMIQNDRETTGYVSIPVDYRAVIWRREEDPPFKYKVGILVPGGSTGYSPHVHVDTGISAWQPVGRRGIRAAPHVREKRPLRGLFPGLIL